MVKMMDTGRIRRLALEARKGSYAPYSRFHVGAALLAEDGRVFQGCNIENAAYTPTICAERTAFFKAVSEGVRRFAAIAVAGGRADARPEDLDFCAPCGVCRQVMAEFCDLDTFQVILVRSEDDYKIYTLRQLLPEAFTPSNLE